MAVPTYQLICPVSYPNADEPIVFSSINIDNLSDLFYEGDTASQSRYTDGWIVKKFPNGIEDYVDWMCRASEITEKTTSYFRVWSGTSSSIGSSTETRTFLTNEIEPNASQPVLRGNILYTGGGDLDGLKGDPRIKHGGSKDFSMGGSIDLYDPSESSFANTTNANTSVPFLARKGSTGEGVQTDFDFLRMFLFKGDFYVAWHWDNPPDLPLGPGGIRDISMSVGNRSITTRLIGEYSSSGGLGGGSVEYTITDTFA